MLYAYEMRHPSLCLSAQRSVLRLQKATRGSCMPDTACMTLGEAGYNELRGI